MNSPAHGAGEYYLVRKNLRGYLFRSNGQVNGRADLETDASVRKCFLLLLELNYDYIVNHLHRSFRWPAWHLYKCFSLFYGFCSFAISDRDLISQVLGDPGLPGIGRDHTICTLCATIKRDLLPRMVNHGIAVLSNKEPFFMRVESLRHAHLCYQRCHVVFCLPIHIVC